MKIAVVCANGKAGRLITKEALQRGLDVTAVVRGENKSEAHQAIIKDLFALTAADLAPFDVVVDAAGGWRSDTVGVIPQAARHLCTLLKGTVKRLLVVGGAGSLFVNKEHTLTVADGENFPESFKPLAAAHQEALTFLRTQKDVAWTYISPAVDFQAEGERTGQYTLAGEELTLNSRGESTISYADYAVALVDEIVAAKHPNERISVISK